MLDPTPTQDEPRVTDADAAAPVEPHAPPAAVQTAARTTRSRAKSATPAKPRVRSPRKKRGPTAAELAAVEELRKELASARQELVAARLEASEVVAACREAEARVAATRAGTGVVRRLVAEVDAAAAAARGVAEAARVESGRAAELSAHAERRTGRARAWLDETRMTFGALREDARRTLDQFRATVGELQAELTGRAPAPAAEPSAPAATPPALDLPHVEPLPPEELANDAPERLAHLLNDAWGAEKELVGMFQTLADESDDRQVRQVFERHRDSARRRQEELRERLRELGASPASGRGLLGQLVARLWDVVRTPRDPDDRAVLALLKGVSATAFQAGLSQTVHGCAALMGDAATAGMAADHGRELCREASQLRAALSTVAAGVVRR